MSVATKERSSIVAVNGVHIPEDKVLNNWEPTVKDRCDVCCSQAYVKIALSNLDNENKKLLFCANHARERIGAIVQQGWFVCDQSSNIIRHDKLKD